MNLPRGNTQKKVNSTVFSLIKSKIDSATSMDKWVDAPCGNGEFAYFLKMQAPQINIIGVDLFADASGKDIQFHKQSAHDFYRQQKHGSIDLITCISGVMCFDGIYELVGLFGQVLKTKGTAIITNDNIMTVRDRLNFLFFGSFKRFKLLYSQNEGNWNVVLPQAIFSLLKKNNFGKIQVRYTSIYAEDFIFLPIALVIYPIFLIKLLTQKNEMTIGERLSLFPFMSLIARHYVIAAEKN